MFIVPNDWQIHKKINNSGYMILEPIKSQKN